MRMIAGAILILAATVLYSARWLGDVIHDSTAVGTPEAGLMTLFAGGLAVLGALGIVLGIPRRSDPADHSQGESTR